MKRIAILSATGSGRKRTLPALKESRSASVVAVHGRPSNKLAALAAEYSVSIHTSLDELSSVPFDILYVASPPFMHLDQISFFARSGLPIICEKPLCISKGDTQEFRHVIQGPFMLAHHLRHQSAATKIKEIVEGQELGPVRSAHFQWNFPLNKTAPSAEWKLNPALGGDNPFYDAGIHAIDLAIFLFGPPMSVFATGVPAPEIGRFDSASALAHYEEFPVFLNASSVQTLVANDLCIYFENGWLRAPMAFSEKSITAIEIYSSDGSCIPLVFEPTNPYKNEVENFCEYVDSGDPHFVGTSLKDALLGMTVLHAISASLQSGRAEVVLS